MNAATWACNFAIIMRNPEALLQSIHSFNCRLPDSRAGRTELGIGKFYHAAMWGCAGLSAPQSGSVVAKVRMQDCQVSVRFLSNGMSFPCFACSYVLCGSYGIIIEHKVSIEGQLNACFLVL